MTAARSTAAVTQRDDEIDEMLRPDDVVARWKGRIQPKTLANWRCFDPSPGPPFARIGNRIMYPLSGIIEYERRHGYGSTKDYGKKR